MTPLRLACALGLALILLAIPAAAQNTIYVDTDASGSETGDSWADAYTSLQDALDDAASTSGDDEIWVAQGTYYPDEGASVTAEDRSATFTVPNGVTLRGRFSGDEAESGDRVLDRGASPTILSGEIQQDGDPSNNAYHVLTLQGGTVEAVRITGGAATGTGSQGEGGGAYVTGGTLKRSFLQGNRAKRGSAIYATNAPELRRLLINDNRATEAGALYLENDDATINNVTVADNTVDATEGVNGIQHVGSTAQVTNSAFGPATTNAVWDGTFTITGDIDNQDGDNLTGDITVSDGDNTKTISTNGDGTFSVDISSDNGFTDGETVDIIANNVADYQSATNQVTLDKNNTTKTSSFDLDVSTTTTTIDLETTVVGNDLYQDSDGDGLGYDDASFAPKNGQLDQLSITYTDGNGNEQTTTASFTDGAASKQITYADTLSHIEIEQNDSDFINTWVMNNTDTETAPNLRQGTSNFSTFPDTPDYQSNYDYNVSDEDQNSSDYDNLLIPTSELVSSYEARVIPARSPRIESSRVDGSRDTKWETYDPTIGEWQLHVSGQGGRWKEREVDGSTRKEVKTYIEDGTSTYEQYASDAYADLRDIVPYPTSSPQNVSSAPNEPNTNWSEEGGKNNNVTYDTGFIQKSWGSFSESNNLFTATSELFSPLTGGYDSVNGDEPDDSIFTNYSSTGTRNLIKRKATFPLRIQYSIGDQGENNIR